MQFFYEIHVLRVEKGVIVFRAWQLTIFEHRLDVHTTGQGTPSFTFCRPLILDESLVKTKIYAHENLR